MNAARSETKWWLCQALAWLFGGVFVFAGWAKALDPGLFLVSIRGFQLLPDPYAAWLALSLPWLEIFAGLAVITGWLRRGGLLLLNACILVFVIALGIAWARGINVECGCFGSTVKTSLGSELLLDGSLLALGVWLLRSEGRCVR